MHIPYSDNKNQALFGETNKTVPLVYFNIINLKKGESYEYQLSKHESSVVPATGIVEISVDDNKLGQIGKRTTDVWDGEGRARLNDQPSVQCFTAFISTVFLHIAEYHSPLMSKD